MQETHLFLRSLDKNKLQMKSHIRPTYIWDRLAAQVIDFLFVYTVGNLFAAPIKRHFEEAVLLENEGAISIHFCFLILTYILIFLIYHSLSLYFFRQTFGKRVFHIQVKSIWESTTSIPVRLNFKTCFLRSLLLLSHILFLGFPLLAVFYDSKRRAIHEKITETYTEAKNKFSTEPTRIEVLWVHAIYAVVLGLGSLFFWIQLDGFKDKYTSVSELLIAPEYLCEEVTTAKDNWSVLEDSRLDVALSLFNANLIEADCLALEAQRALSFEEEQDKAYLSMGLVHQNSSELSAQYIEKVCDLNLTGEPCLLIQLLDAFSSENYDLSHQILSQWKNPMSTYANVVAIRQLYSEKKYNVMQTKIELLWENNPLKKFLSLYRTLGHYENKNFEKAQEAFVLTYPDLNFDQQKALSALVCEKEVLNACRTQESQSCDKLEQNVVNSELGELSDKEFVTYLKYASCPGQKIDKAIDVLGAKVETSEQVAMIAAVRADQQKKYDVEKVFLEQIVNTAAAESEIFHEAQLMLLKQTSDAEKLKSIFKTWESLSPFHPHYFSLGLALLQQYVEVKNLDLAMQIYEFLEMSYPQNLELQIAGLNILPNKNAPPFQHALTRKDNLQKDQEKTKKNNSQELRMPASIDANPLTQERSDSL